MPSQAAIASSPTAQELLGNLPGYMRDDPDIQGFYYAVSVELDALGVRAEEVRDEMFPQTSQRLLDMWEELVRLPTDHTLDLDTRHNALVATLRKLAQGPSGLLWISLVTEMVGSGWGYVEHDPDDTFTPPDYTERIYLPQPAGSPAYNRARKLVRDTIGAHLHLIVESADGFVLDQSELDQEGLG